VVPTPRRFEACARFPNSRHVVIRGLIVFLVVCLAFAQADVLVKTRQQALDLANDVKHQISLFEKHSEKVMNKVENTIKSTHKILAEKTKLKTEAALQKAQALDCQEDTHKQIQDIPESIAERLQECINFTKSIVDIEQYIYDAAGEIKDVETLVCNAIHNLTTCNSIENWFDQVGCIMQSFESLQNVIFNNKNIWGFLGKMNDLSHTMVHHVFKCFTNTDIDADNKINEALVNCVPNGQDQPQPDVQPPIQPDDQQPAQPDVPEPPKPDSNA